MKKQVQIVIFSIMIITLMFFMGCDEHFDSFLPVSVDSDLEEIGSTSSESNAESEVPNNNPMPDDVVSIEEDTIYSGMCAVTDGEWVYFGSASKNGLYRMRENGLELQKLSSDYPIYDIKIFDGWVYYISSPKVENSYLPSNLNRIRVDGSDRQVLFEKCSNYCIADKGIFFSPHNSSDIIKADFNGTNESVVGHGTVVNIVGEWIYYENDNQIKRISVYGGESESIANGRMRSVQGYKEWLYFYGEIQNKRGIYKMRPDGSELSFFVDPRYFNPILIVDGYLFYQSTPMEITKISLENDELIQVSFESNISTFTVQGDWIYFEKVESVFNNWRIRIDGTGIEEL